MNTELLVYSVVAGSLYGLVGLGFAVTYKTAGFFNVAQGALITGGAYFTWLFHHVFALPIVISSAAAMLAAGMLGALIEIAIFRPLRHAGGSGVQLLIGSLGIYVVLENLISLSFGDDIKSIKPEVVQQGIYMIGARVTSIQISTFVTCVVLTVIMGAMLKKTRIGLAIRAVANDSDLAHAVGIERDRVILSSMVVGSALGALAGILAAYDTDMNPTMGLPILMMGVVSVIIGGTRGIAGILGGGLLLGLARHFGIWQIGAEWQDAISLLILVMFLLIRPEGLVGRGARKRIV